jgi:dihydroxyacetone kinase phosphotransfer subunit
MRKIGIVIVSHSPLVAEGTAIMAKKIAGEDLSVAWCGGGPDGGLGSNADMIHKAIEHAWSNDGVAIFVDLGSTEMNSLIAIEGFATDKQSKIVILDAPLVEGVIVASSRAANGDSLSDIVVACESI